MIQSTTEKQFVKSDEPILERVLLQARREDREVREMLDLMGWKDLPEELVIEVKEDIRAFRRELEGSYSSCDPFVERRRKRVTYWVRLFLSGGCSLEAALCGLRGRRF